MLSGAGDKHRRVGSGGGRRASPVPTSSPTRSSGPTSRSRVRDVVSALRRADQAPDHRAAAGHHRARPCSWPPAGCRRCGWCSRRWSAAASRPPAPTSSTACWTATSTSGCAAPVAGRCRGTRSDPRARPSSVWCSAIAATLWLGLLRQLAVGAAGAGRERVLRLRLHHVAEAADVAEHRLGWHRRLLPAADRLDRRHRVSVALAPFVLFADRLLLDAAAHLGAGHALPRGLRRGRGADAAGGHVRPGGRPPDPGLLGADRGRRRWPCGRSPAPAWSTRWWPPSPARRCCGESVAAAASGANRGCTDAALKPMRLFHWSNSYLAAGLRRRRDRPAAALTRPELTRWPSRSS